MGFSDLSQHIGLAARLTGLATSRRRGKRHSEEQYVANFELRSV
jgi:hypothetical protein